LLLSEERAQASELFSRKHENYTTVSGELVRAYDFRELSVYHNAWRIMYSGLNEQSNNMILRHIPTHQLKVEQLKQEHVKREEEHKVEKEVLNKDFPALTLSRDQKSKKDDVNVKSEHEESKVLSEPKLVHDAEPH
jgi:hypothetical protein